MTADPPIVAPPLTRRESEVLDFVRSFLADHGGISPRLRDIGDHFGICHEAARIHVMNLESKGRLTYQRKAHRSIRLLA